MTMTDRLNPSEIIKLRTKYPAALDHHEWAALYHYAMRNYEKRGYKKHHNTLVRKLHLLIIAHRIGKHISNMNLSCLEHQRLLLKP